MYFHVILWQLSKHCLHKMGWLNMTRKANKRKIGILLNGWILPIGGPSAVKGLRLQPEQQACFIKSWQLFSQNWALPTLPHTAHCTR